MADVHEVIASENHQSNGVSEIERLMARVKELEAKCASMQLALAKVEEDRDRYLKAVYAYEREKLASPDLENLTITHLENYSGNSVELLDPNEGAACHR